MHKLFLYRIGYTGTSLQFYGTLRFCGASEKTKRMKSLDFAAMENINGGTAGAISINLPLSGLLSVLGLGSLLNIGLGATLGITYNIGDINLPILGGLGL